MTNQVVFGPAHRAELRFFIGLVATIAFPLVIILAMCLF